MVTHLKILALLNMLNVDLKFFLKSEKRNQSFKKGRQFQWFAVLFTTSLVAIDDSVYPR